MTLPTEFQQEIDAPESFQSVEDLEEFLTRPQLRLIKFIKTVEGPLVILGAGGKMGPTLAVLAQRAAKQAGHSLEIIAISRFSDQSSRQWLEKKGITTLSCDLLNRKAVEKLPPAANVLSLVGLKFGTAKNPASTWAANTIASAYLAEHYCEARIVALSTGNVYPFSKNDKGAMETDALTPLGEYANAAVGRERVFEFFSGRNSTPIVLLRLFYAVELRYGVIRDIAEKIWVGEAVPLGNSKFNCIWQGDANEYIIRALTLAQSPAAAFNLTSSEVFNVREVARVLGELLGKAVRFSGEENETSLTGNSSKLFSLLGSPTTSMDMILRWTANWVKQGGASLNRPTHFEIRDGSY